MPAILFFHVFNLASQYPSEAGLFTMSCVQYKDFEFYGEWILCKYLSHEVDSYVVFIAYYRVAIPRPIILYGFTDRSNSFSFI